MAFLHRLVELKLNNERYPTDTESGLELDNRLFNTENTAVNGGVQSTQTARLPSLSNITLKNLNEEQIKALNTLNNNAQKFEVSFTLAGEGGDVTYSGTVKIEGELVYSSQAGTLTLNLMSADGQEFKPI